MRHKNSRFIVIEGIDGCGKTVQTERLITRLRREGFPVATISFPRYDSPASYCVQKYLRGEYGTIEDIDAFQASVLFAVDRFDARNDIRRWLEEGMVVVSNRYVASNMAHQGAKLANLEERARLFEWLHQFEYGILRLPKPDLNVVLNISPEIARELIGKKDARGYLGDKKRDIHEADSEHLRRSADSYKAIAVLLSSYSLVSCESFDGPGFTPRLLSEPEIHDMIWRLVLPLLQSEQFFSPED